MKFLIKYFQIGNIAIMNAALQKTIFHLTGKSSLAQVQKEELETMLNDFPFFAPLQLAYVAKLNTADTHQANIQLQKTGLYCTNQKWLQYQLMDASNFDLQTSNNYIANIEIPTIETVKDLMNGVEKKVVVDIDKIQDTVKDIPNQPEAQIVEEIPALPVNEPNNAAEVDLQEKNAVETPINNNLLEETLVPVYVLEKPLVIENKEAVVEYKNEEKINPNAIELDIEVPTLVLQEEQPLIQEVLTNEVADTSAKEVIESKPLDSLVEDAQISNALIVENETNAEVPIALNNDIHAQIAKLKEDWNKPVLKEEKLPFEAEPYYTIDYFASQGIKFDFNKEPKDVLTTKMLRFTDWLKRMKSAKEINAEVEDDDSQDIEAAIVNIANISNQPKEIVTETMAQVFEKQGKINKAVQLYIKLSFLNPDKTAYFATKIQELKGIKS